MTRNTFFTLVFAAAVTAVPAFSANSSIGVATALAGFSIGNSTVTGDTDVFEGSALRTTVAPSDVHLENGAEIRLATRSAGTIYTDHLLLEDGAVRVANFDKYPVRAGQLEVKADDPAAQAVVRFNGRKIEIASIGGAVKVTDGGAMLTRVAAGTKMSFQNTGSNSPQTGANAGQPPAVTGAAPAPQKGPFPNKKVVLWSAGVCAVGAAVVGGIAAAQGKSPFPGR